MKKKRNVTAGPIKTMRGWGWWWWWGWGWGAYLKISGAAGNGESDVLGFTFCSKKKTESGEARKSWSGCDEGYEKNAFREL